MPEQSLALNKVRGHAWGAGPAQSLRQAQGERVDVRLRAFPRVHRSMNTDRGKGG